MDVLLACSISFATFLRDVPCCMNKAGKVRWPTEDRGTPTTFAATSWCALRRCWSGNARNVGNAGNAGTERDLHSPIGDAHTRAHAHGHVANLPTHILRRNSGGSGSSVEKEKQLGTTRERIRLVVLGGASVDEEVEVAGLVWVVCASLSLFRQFFTIARTRETLCYLIYLFPRRCSWDTVVCIHLVEEIMADLARFSALFIILCS